MPSNQSAREQDRKIRALLDRPVPPLRPAARTAIITAAAARLEPRPALGWRALVIAGAAVTAVAFLAIVLPRWDSSSAGEAAAVLDEPGERVELVAVGELVRVQGLARSYSAVEGETEATVGAVVLDEAQVTTGADGWVELLADRRFRLFVEPESDARVSYEDVRVECELARGAIVVHADHRRPFEELVVRAGATEVWVRGTRFRVTRRDNEVRVELESGELEVVMAGKTVTRLAAMQQLTLAADGEPQLAMLISAEAEQVRVPFPEERGLAPRSTAARVGHQPAAGPEGSTEIEPAPAETPESDPFALARALFFGRDYEGAVRLLTPWLAAEPPAAQPRARLLLGDALRLSGRADEALGVYDELAEAAPVVAEPAIFEALSLRFGQGEGEAALRDAELYLRRFPSGALLPEVAALVAEHGSCAQVNRLLNPLVMRGWGARERLAVARLRLRCPPPQPNAGDPPQ